MLIERLVYGCSRLAGGASERESRQLLDRCLEAGIRHFDTAPSYGIGTAEGVVGRAVGELADVRITAKLGSVRPRHALIKTWARKAKRMYHPNASQLDRPFTQPDPRLAVAGMDFSPMAMRGSLDRSRHMLRRDRFDLLLAHEVGDFASQPEAMALLDDEYRAGRATAVGYAIGHQFEAAGDISFPNYFVAQAGLRSDWLTGDLRPPKRTHFFHSIGRASQQMKRENGDIAAMLATTTGSLGPASPDRVTADLGVIFALIHARDPDAGLIFASTNPYRLDAFLGIVDHIDRSIGVQALAEVWRRSGVCA